MNQTFDVIIIGAGIVGLATAYKILTKRPGIKLAVVEKEKEVAKHQTSHNSGVIHSGIYYKPGSLKALNCRAGYAELLDFCKDHEIPHEICGKVIVAAKDKERNILDSIFQRGLKNGMEGIRKIGTSELNEIEPYAKGVEAIYVPQAGIISFKRVANKLRDLIDKSSGEVLTGRKVVGIHQEAQGSVVITNYEEFKSRLTINCAGLYADKLAEMCGEKLDVKIIPFRGEYYKLVAGKEYLVRNLIYPVPNPAFPFLGVHFTKMIDGGIEAGPNAVLAFRREGYNLSDFHFGEFAEMLMFKGFQMLALKHWRIELNELLRSFSKKAFVKALQHLIPDVSMDDLERAGSGVRAQAVDQNGNTVDDFMIIEKPAFVHIINAPSPAATSSLAIGETVSSLALKKF